jgi:hypothetical protein
MLLSLGVLVDPSFAKASEGKAADKPLRQAQDKPNVLMFAVDDMCDWIGADGARAGRHAEHGPLAAAGLTFQNAHTAGIFCAPSRSSIFSGRHASTTGCYTTQVYFANHPDDRASAEGAPGAAATRPTARASCSITRPATSICAAGTSFSCAAPSRRSAVGRWRAGRSTIRLCRTPTRTASSTTTANRRTSSSSSGARCSMRTRARWPTRSAPSGPASC